jgi:NADH-quinone oxidoreductase subunit J
MLIAFGVAAAVAILATIGVIASANPVHALLNLIVSLLAVSMIFFTVGAPFAGALEIIVYAGAIMVLFVFVVMMLNLGEAAVAQERRWLSNRNWLVPALLCMVLLGELCYALPTGHLHPAGIEVDSRQVGIALFGPYLLAVELASMLLLAALVGAYHLGHSDD